MSRNHPSIAASPGPIFNGRPGESVPQFVARRVAEFGRAMAEAEARGERIYAPPLPRDPDIVCRRRGRGWAS